MLSDQMILRNNSGMYVNIHSNNNIYYNANEHIFYNGITSQGHIVPSVDSTYNLGSTSLQWANVYADTATFSGDVTVNGGDITLGGTGRIQGIDTVSATTDAANKAYVDAHTYSHNHDDRYYTESEMQTFFNRGYISSHSANNLPVGWYTIATNTGDRALGEFQIWDTASGDHQSVLFNASHHFGTNSSNDITVLANSRYSGTNFRYIRIKENGTYDGAALQVYVDGTSNSCSVAIVGGNAQESGWVIKDWVADATDPGDVTGWANFVESCKVDLDNVVNGGMISTGEMYLGGVTTQYKAFHDNYHPNADKWTTARTVTFSGGDVTGNFTIDGSADVTGVNLQVTNGSHTHAASDITSGNLSAARNTVNLANVGSSSDASGIYFRSANEVISGEGWCTAQYAYNQNDGFLFLNRNDSGTAFPTLHIGGWNNAGYITGYSDADGLLTLTRSDGSKSQGSTYAGTGLSNTSYYTNIIKTTAKTVFRDAQGLHEFTGNVLITGSGSANSASLQIDNPDSNAFNHSIEAFAANLTNGESNVILVGKEGSTKNSGYIGYYWTSAGSNNNFVSLGHWAADHLFRIYGDQVLSTVTLRSNVDMQSPIYYDKNNTDYYAHLDSTTTSLKIAGPIVSTGPTSGTTAANRAFQVNTTTKGALHSDAAAGGTSGSADTVPLVTFSGNSAGSIQGGIYGSQNASTGTTLGFFTTDSYAVGPKQSLTIEDGGNVYVNRGMLQASTSVRGTIFYDTNDTEFYLNPADSASRLNGIFFGKANNDRSGAVPVALNDGQLLFRTNTDYNHKMWYYDGLNFSTNPSHGHIRFWADSSSRTNGAGGSTLVLDSDCQNVHTTIYGSTRSPIYYDSNDTAYYANLQSLSHIRKIAGVRTNLATSEAWGETNAWGVNNQTGYFGGDFTINGSSNENNILWEDGPHGSGISNKKELIWKVRTNSSDSGADGGWNKTITGIDYNKSHISILYVKRVADGNGNFYHGTTTCLNLSGSTNTNPYFQARGAQDLPLGVWCVSIGFLRANNDTASTAATSFSGIYRLDTGERIHGATDFRLSASTTSQHRCFLYYATNTNSELWFANPGFYEINGNEPKLSEILMRPEDRMDSLRVDIDMRAPIFYDSNNTGRYIDPASTSKIDKLEIANTSNQDSPGSRMKIGSDGFIFGGNNDGYEVNSAQISAGYHTANSLNFVGMGTTSSVRRMDFWAEGGFYVSGTIYDKDATNYYINPGSASKIKNIGVNTDPDISGSGGYINILNSSGVHGIKIDTVSNSSAMKITTVPYGGGISINYNRGTSGLTTGSVMSFLHNGASAGSIQVTSSNTTSYGTSSDYRLKENIVELTGAITRVKQLQPKRFNFISDDDSIIFDGFLAHEAKTVVPESVIGEKDEVDDNNEPVYQNIDQSKLVPLLTAALKEAIQKIEDLEARVQTLEN
jgi:hypothetical protein